MSKVRVLYINHSALVNGGEASLLELVGNLDKERFEPIVVIPPAFGTRAPRMRRMLSELGVRTLPMPLIRFRRTHNPLALLGYLFNVVTVSLRLAGLISSEKIDLVHSNSTTAHIYGSTAAWLARVPSVWHCRDLVDLGWLGRWLCRRSTAAIGISNTVAAHLERYAVNPDNVVAISNGVAVDLEPPPSATHVRRKLGIRDDTFVVVMIAQMVPWKNHAQFIDAAAKVGAENDKAVFVVIGDDMFEDHLGYRQKLESQAARLGLSGKMKFVGYREDVGELLSCADLLVHPAANEPFGRVVAEAMARSKPVVAVNSAGPADIVIDGETGFLVACDDAGAMARAILSLAGDSKLRAAMGDAGRKRAVAMFGAVRVAREVEAQYDKLQEAQVRDACVAFVVDTFPSIYETFIAREILAMREQGMKVRVYALKGNASEAVHPESMSLMPDACRGDGMSLSEKWGAVAIWVFTRPGRLVNMLALILVRIATSPVAGLRMLRYLPMAVGLARDARARGVTRMHGHFAFVPADVAMMMARGLGVEYSLSVHAWDIYTQSPDEIWPRLEAASLILACTEHGRDHLLTLFPGMLDDRLVLARHGVDLREFPARDSNACEPGAILAVGRLVEKKGFNHLIDACKQLSDRGIDYSCTIAGDGPLRTDLQRQAAEHGLSALVQFPGELAQDEIRGLYEKAMVFVVPSVVGADGDMDGVPNVLIEALAIGVPVVGSSVAAIPEVIEDGVTGSLVPAGDAVAIADSLERLLMEPASAEMLIEGGRRRIAAEFDATANAARLVSLFSCRAPTVAARPETDRGS